MSISNCNFISLQPSFGLESTDSFKLSTLRWNFDFHSQFIWFSLAFWELSSYLVVGNSRFARFLNKSETPKMMIKQTMSPWREPERTSDPIKRKFSLVPWRIEKPNWVTYNDVCSLRFGLAQYTKPWWLMRTGKNVSKALNRSSSFDIAGKVPKTASCTC